MFIQDRNATENAEGGEGSNEDDDYREDDEGDQGGELHSTTKSFTALHHRQYGLSHYKSSLGSRRIPTYLCQPTEADSFYATVTTEDVSLRRP